MSKRDSSEGGVSAAKKSKTGEAEAGMESEELQAQYDKMVAVQEKIEKLNEESSQEVLKIERAFNVRRRPLYQERNALCKQIPRFWLQAIMHHRLFAELLNEDATSSETLEALKHIEEIDVEDFEDLASGFRITFRFSENEFFTNKELFKEFKYGEDGELTVKASDINWKKDKNLLAQEEDNFFSLFSPDTEEVEIAEIIKEEIWPDPVKFFMGHAGDDDDFGEDDDDDDEEDIEDEA